MDQEHSHLYGLILVLITKSEEMLHFFMEDLCHHGSINLTDITFLIKVCRKLRWINGVILLINSFSVKSMFVQAPLSDKLSFLKQMLSLKFVKSFILSKYASDNLQSVGFIKQLKQTLYTFPYSSVCWLDMDPLLEEDFNFKRYINCIKINFSPKCVEMLQSQNQIHEIIRHMSALQADFKRKSEATELRIENEIEETNKGR